jgi:ferredoxin-NADP reductase
VTPRLLLSRGVPGIAPMIQILRAFLHYQVGQGTPGPTSASGVTLVYAAERQYDLCFTQLLTDIRDKHPDFFTYYTVLVNLPS